MDDAYEKKVLDLLESIRADGISTNASERIEESFIRAIVKRGYEYHVWTIDDPAEAKQLFALGADGVMTDDPRRLCSGLGKI